MIIYSFHIKNKEIRQINKKNEFFFKKNKKNKNWKTHVSKFI